MRPAISKAVAALPVERVWVNPDTLAKLDITVNEIATALQAQNTVNPAGQLGGDPAPSAQEFTFTLSEAFFDIFGKPNSVLLAESWITSYQFANH